MDGVVLSVFLIVYVGMILGRAPGLAVDRTGVALLGAIVLLVTERVGVDEAWASIDVTTIGLLVGLMVVSAQFRLGGLYTAATQRIAATRSRPEVLLGLLILLVGLFSALLANDIVALAMTPLLVEVCARRGLAPVPFLLALACAANIGSAATVIGNPQNILVGQALDLPFGGYLLDGGPVALLGLGALWVVMCWRFRGKWLKETPVPEVEVPAFDLWQSVKGVTVLALLVVGFLLQPLPREILALGAAGILLSSRKLHSRRMLGLVDWQLLILFIGLFIVNHALETSGAVARAIAGLGETGVDLGNPGWLFVVTPILSNMVSNVPAVMLLLPAAEHPLSGPILALSSSLAGNFFLIGSIANLIVVDQASRVGVTINWKDHARVGVPVTVVTLVIAAGWLWLRWSLF